MMKKIFALALAAMMAVCLLAIPAAAENDVVIAVETVNAQPGETVDVSMNVTGEFAVHSVNIWVDFDNTKLTLNSLEKGEAIETLPSGGMALLSQNDENNSIRLGIMMPMEPLTAQGTFFTANFTVAETVEPGTTIELTLQVKEFSYMPDSTSTPVENTPVNGAVVIPATETEEPVEPTEEPGEPTEEPVEPTEEPGEPTEEPGEPTEEPGAPTEEPGAPTAEPTTPPAPSTGAISIIGAGLAALAAGAGIVIFKKKED